ncbi:hypothetical protein [Ottowia sp.]|uniref:hypothetical protein n=1 Tax=Ottowia sp. TaxID=1898956 RepID=UPI0025D84387|nr:hypothetical protein [Ottowia sp.]MBK6616637.1 hypothetical protein [Ottowia sp.]
MYSLTRNTLVAHLATAFVGLQLGVGQHFRQAMLLANMLPQDQPLQRLGSKRPRPGSKSGQKRHGGPRKLHHRQKRKAHKS